MQANRGRNTQLEVALGSALHRRGLRFWKHRRPLADLRCEADFVFPRMKLAIFVNGCFWHGCSQHATWPVANAEFWKAKIEGTRVRDIRSDGLLLEAGWAVVRLWEHQPIDEMAEEVETAVRRARSRELKIGSGAVLTRATSYPTLVPTPGAESHRRHR